MGSSGNTEEGHGRNQLNKLLKYEYEFIVAKGEFCRWKKQSMQKYKPLKGEVVQATVRSSGVETEGGPITLLRA